MNQSNFVGTLRAQAINATVADTLAILKDPPGRQPDPHLVELAAWFDGLSTVDSRLKTVGSSGVSWLERLEMGFRIG
ncbi:MAG: hypothetical protein M3Y87_04430 [Myxococcota bacterium]|nr:hypothetical protein [Myxococcota bacterium]